MVPKWKRWLGAASILLLAGAGCRTTVEPEASMDVDAGVETGAGMSGEKEEDGRMPIDADASATFESAADAALDAMLMEADADAMAEYEEGTDADIVGNDDAELDAYGNAYVKTEL